MGPSTATRLRNQTENIKDVQNTLSELLSGLQV